MYHYISEIAVTASTIIALMLGVLIGYGITASRYDEVYDAGWSDGVTDTIKAIQEIEHAKEELEAENAKQSED